jgi:hypothetical protein
MSNEQNPMTRIANSLANISTRLAYAFPHPKDCAFVACPSCTALRLDLQLARAINAELTVRLDQFIGRAPVLRWTAKPPQVAGFYLYTSRRGGPLEGLKVTTPGLYSRWINVLWCGPIVIEEPVEDIKTTGADAADPVVRPVNTGVGPGPR